MFGRWAHPGAPLRLVRTIFLGAVGEQVEGVFADGEAVFLGDFFLAFFNVGVAEFFHFPALQADQVVVVVALVEFEHRFVAFEVVAHQQAGGFELGEDAVDGGEADVFAFRDQCLVHVFGGEMAHRAGFEQLEDFEPRQGDFEPGVFQV